MEVTLRPVFRMVLPERDWASPSQMLSDPSFVICERLSCGCGDGHALCRPTSRTTSEEVLAREILYQR